MKLIILMILFLTSCVTTRSVGSNCLPTRMVGWLNNEDVTELDWWNFNTAKASCPTRFEGRAPCLTTFVKRGTNDYYAECGKER